MTQNED